MNAEPIVGPAGRDIVRCGDGDDVVNAGAGEEIRWGAGNDTIAAGLGDDFADGESGNDTWTAREAPTPGFGLSAGEHGWVDCSRSRKRDSTDRRDGAGGRADPLRCGRMVPGINAAGRRFALVTGACGFVGRHLVRDLIADHDEIWMVDDLSSGRHPDTWLPSLLNQSTGWGDAPRIYDRGRQRVVFVKGNAIEVFGAGIGVLGAPAANNGLSWPQFDEAYHLASVVGGRKKIENEPLEVGIDLAVDSVFFLWAARAERLQRLLYASSSAAYPIELQAEDGAVPLREGYIDFAANRVPMPDMTYGWSKLTGEYLAYVFARSTGVPAWSVRPFSGYGEDQDPSYPIPAIGGRAARREDPLVVWGSSLQGRDFVHIDDCIRAMRSAIRVIEDGSGINIGSGILTTFLKVAEILAALADYEPKVRGTQTRPVSVHARHADSAVSRKLLSWQPKVSLQEGLRRVLHAQEEALATPDRGSAT